MCEECYMIFCPDGCPNCDSGGPIGRCEICGEYIYSGSEYVANDEKLYCASCVEDFDTDKILLVCGFCEVIELLRELGVEIKKED